MRRVPALIGAAALVAASLAGCTALPGTGGCAPAHDSGNASSIVTASGAIGSIGDVEFPTPLVSKTPQVSVLEHGDGAVVRDGDQVDYSFARYYGADGQDLTGEEAGARTEAGVEGDAVSEALVCANVGDRLVLTSTLEQAYGEGAGGENVADDDTIVLVIDVTAAYLGKADGFNQLPADGMPTVVTEVDGAPGISVLLQTPPTVTRNSVIKAGSGATIADADVAVVHFRIWTWPATVGEQPTLVQSGDSWSNGQAGNLAVTSLADGGGLPPGLYDALLGQKVGSQVLSVIPPGDDSFAAGTGPAGDDATYIFVVDILGIQQ